MYVWDNVTYLQYEQSRWGLRTPSMAAGGLPNPTHLERGGGYDFFQAQDQQVTTRSPR